MELHHDGCLLFEHILIWVACANRIISDKSLIGKYGWHVVDLRLCKTGGLIFFFCEPVTSFVTCNFSKETKTWRSFQKTSEVVRLMKFG